MKLFIALLLLIARFAFSEEMCLLTPPADWEIASSEQLSPHLQVAFIKKTKSRFRPSLNLTVEKVNASLDEYVKAVQKIHDADHQTRWRRLGSIDTSAGPAVLTELDMATEWGSVRMLQLLLVRNGSAFIVTGAALKEEFSIYYQTFHEIFKTISCTQDLASLITDPAQQDTLQKAQQKVLDGWTQTPDFQSPHFQKNHWEPFVKTIEKQYPHMGSHWQLLAIKAMQEHLLTPTKSENIR